MANQQDLESGARQVEATEHLASGLTEPGNLGVNEGEVENGPAETMLGDLSLSMFQQGSTVHIRAGSPGSIAEVYEGTYEDANEANAALLEEGILTADQVPDRDQLLGTGVPVSGVSSEQLLRAGLKQKGHLGSF